MSDQTEEVLISFFVGGLKPELKSELKIGRPPTLRKAFALAKMHEAHRHSRKGGGFVVHLPSLDPLIKNPPTTSKALPIVRKTLTAEERRKWSAKGLYFNCDDPYFPGHRCKGRLSRLDAEGECLVELEPTVEPVA